MLLAHPDVFCVAGTSRFFVSSQTLSISSAGKNMCLSFQWEAKPKRSFPFLPAGR